MSLLARDPETANESMGILQCYIKHRSLLARDPETANESMGILQCYIKHRSLLARDPETANESMGTFQCAINIESGLWTNIGTCHLIKTLILQWKVGLDFFSLYTFIFTRSGTAH
jgi:hypothetical protein